MQRVTWTGPVTTGRSHQTYFGSIAGERDVFVIIPAVNPAGGVPTWHLAFNDNSLRKPTRETFSSLDAAKAAAEGELNQSISHAGQRARVAHAFSDTRCKFPKHRLMSDDEIYAACEFVAPRYRDIDPSDIYAHFGRHRAAA